MIDIIKSYAKRSWEIKQKYEYKRAINATPENSA